MFETYFDPFSGTMIEDIGDDDVFVAERDMKIPEGKLATKYLYLPPFLPSVKQAYFDGVGDITWKQKVVTWKHRYKLGNITINLENSLILLHNQLT